jgi:hypothetical protein
MNYRRVSHLNFPVQDATTLLVLPRFNTLRTTAAHPGQTNQAAEGHDDGHSITRLALSKNGINQVSSCQSRHNVLLEIIEVVFDVVKEDDDDEQDQTRSLVSRRSSSKETSILRPGAQLCPPGALLFTSKLNFMTQGSLYPTVSSLPSKNHFSCCKEVEVPDFGCLCFLPRLLVISLC